MTNEQQLVDRRASHEAAMLLADTGVGHRERWSADEAAGQEAERRARQALKAQIARIERELSAVVAERFPHVQPLIAARASAAGPRLLDLAELERTRDRLAGQLQQLRGLAAERAAREQAARERLQRMKLEPGRYKFARIPVRDLGQGVCGVWEVRPRLGLIGMLAGWWQLKLSSGCPLARGSRSKRDPAQPS